MRELIVTGELEPPALPEVASRLLARATHPDVSLRELEKEISADPMIAARVMKVANSSLYNPRSVLATTLRIAAARLGIDALRNILCQAVAESYVFSGRQRAALRLHRRHAVAVAHLSRHASRLLEVDGEHAFLCGLFHDLGQPMFLQLIDKSGLAVPPTERVQTMDLVHPLLGERLARKWNLPAAAGEVARFHHAFRVGDELDHAHVVKVVAAADRAAYHVGLGSREVPENAMEDPRWAELGIPAAHVPSLLARAEELTTQAE